ITKAEPMATGFSAVRSGIVMFLVPFVFAFYPEILLITDAVLDPSAPGGSSAFLPGYDGELHLGHLALVIARLMLALYLVSSALAGFDSSALSKWEVLARLVLAVLIMTKSEAIFGAAALAGIGLLSLHHIRRERLA
ncbi:MAG: C4-dicarboxylate ABC transporter, partial [Pseudomonadota bacterium]